MSNYENSIILDHGSMTFKAGLANFKQPQIVFPSIVGRRTQHVKINNPHLQNKSLFIGDEAEQLKEFLSLSSPITRGEITQWEEMQEVWHYTFAKLNVDTYYSPILLAENPLQQKAYKEKLFELMFEIFSPPAIYYALKPILSLNSSGRATGIVLESGGGVTHIVPIYQDQALPSTLKLNIGGEDLTTYMSQLLITHNENEEISESTLSDPKIARTIKENFSYVADHFSNELERSASVDDIERYFDLPNRQHIMLKNERFTCPEALFNPSFMKPPCNSMIPALHEAINYTIQRTDVNLQPTLYENIILAGGNTKFPGLAPRLRNEIMKLSSNANVNVIVDDVNINSWRGASALANHDDFPKMWINRDEYYEDGASLIHRKFFI